MRNLNQIFVQCLREVENAGIEHGRIMKVEVNTRARHRWGQCKKQNGFYYINVSSVLLDERNPIESLKNTIIHEIIHTCEGCMNHGRKWQELAEIINRKYGYNIKRASTEEEKGVCAETIPQSRYQIVCEKCGAVYSKDRMCNLVKFPQFYRCGKCNGNLKRAK